MVFRWRKPLVMFTAATVAFLSLYASTPGAAFADTFVYQSSVSNSASGTFFFTHCDTDAGVGGCYPFSFQVSSTAFVTYDEYYNANGYYWISWIKDQMSACISNAQNSNLPFTVSAGTEDNHNQYRTSAHTDNSIPWTAPATSVCVAGWSSLHDNYKDGYVENQPMGTTDDPGNYQAYDYGIVDGDVGNG